MGQGDNRWPCTSRTMTDATIVQPILMTGLRSASYKTKRGDRTLKGAIPRKRKTQPVRESYLRDFNTT